MAPASRGARKCTRCSAYKLYSGTGPDKSGFILNTEVKCLCPLVRLCANCEILFYYFARLKNTFTKKQKPVKMILSYLRTNHTFNQFSNALCIHKPVGYENLRIFFP